MMNSGSNYPGRTFNRRYQEIEREIPFDPSWANGTGYLDGAVHFPLPPGDTAKSIDPHGRRIILIGTRFGTVAVFDRFVNQTDGGTYVLNKPASPVLDRIVTSTAIGGGEMSDILGDLGLDNIGQTIEMLAIELAGK